MDGIPALVLWDLVMEVFHSAPKAFLAQATLLKLGVTQ